MNKVLTIAGSDCSGGAGIQADLKTMTAHNVYGMSVITALTAQNTLGVEAVLQIDTDFISKQIDCVFTDIVPDSTKIGMVSSVEIIDLIEKKLRQYEAKNIVVDPVMVATSGARLIDENAIESLKNKLFPLATLITPNIFEAEILSGIKINDINDMKKSAKLIFDEFKVPVLCKGGHSKYDSTDILFCGEWYTFSGDKINNNNTHGTGCTLSSAIACNLAKGFNLEHSIRLAKKYISEALRYGLNLGKGSGPLNHCIKVD